MTVKDFVKKMEIFHDERRKDLDDNTLLCYFEMIKQQFKAGFRSDEEVLAKYVNELECRGLKYDIDIRTSK